MSSKNSKYILAKYDVSGIQDYIFATNRLRENAGASYQVTRVLDEYLVEAFQEAAVQDEIILDWSVEDKFSLPESENIKAEIIYIGGGNAVVLFRDHELFRKIGERMGMKAAENCQGLSLVVSYIETDLLDFAEDRKRLDDKMSKMKRNMIRQPVYSPFPVTEQDNTSYQPITCCMRHGDVVENMTRIQFQKRTAYKNIRSFQRLFPTVGNGVDYCYPEAMDQLCRKHGEDSYIAIVHIDGNGMGERINRQIQEHKTYSEGVPGIRRISKEIARLFRDTYAEVLQELWYREVFENSDQQDYEKIVPLRPIILDGDDFTFLCRAELAVPVTTAFMMKLMQKQRNVARKITACGGIAFVHSHFPFRVAYSIAEESCSRAKNKWYSQNGREGRENASCFLDFQIIKETEAELPAKNKDWQKRPYAVNLEDDEINENSLRGLYDTLKNIEDWPSGRLHRIYRTFQEGEAAMKLLEREFASRGYEIGSLVQGKWQESPLFDALELRGLCRMDLLGYFLTEIQ